MRIVSGDRRAALLLTVFVLLVPWVWIAARTLGGMANHIGFDPRFLAISTVPTLMWFLQCHGRTTTSRVLVLLAAISIAGLFWLRSSHWLIEYETWLERGMPSPGAAR